MQADDEWAKATKAGAIESRRRLLRAAAVVCAGLLLAAGAVGTWWWVSIGSKAPAGARCQEPEDCASGTLCIDYRCRELCDDGACSDGRLVCAEAPTFVVGTGANFEQTARRSGFRNLCFPREDLPRIERARQELFRGN